MKTDMFMLPKEKEELEWLLHVLRIAIDRFNEMESFLLKNGHSEQCLCARLALHLENALHTADKSEASLEDVGKLLRTNL